MTSKTALPVLLVLALSTALTGCSTPAASDAPDPLNLDAMLSHTTDFQRAIIEDGVVTPAEFERALLARRECVAEAGAVPGEIYEGRNGEPTFDFDITADTEDEMQQVQDRADACLRDYFADVGSVWAYQRLLTPEERDKTRPLALACLDKAGLTDLPEDASVADMAAAIRRDGEISKAERDCVMKFNSLFSTWTDPKSHEGE